MDATYLSPDAVFQMHCKISMYDYHFLNLLNNCLVISAHSGVFFFKCINFMSSLKVGH